MKTGEEDAVIEEIRGVYRRSLHVTLTWTCSVDMDAVIYLLDGTVRNYV